MTTENDDQFVDLNVLDSDNIVVQLTQEIAFEVGAVLAINGTLSLINRGANALVMKATNKTIQQQASRLVSDRMLERIKKVTNMQIRQKINKAVKKIVDKILRKNVTKAGTRAGEKLLRAGETAGTLCATTGPATAGTGCAVAAGYAGVETLLTVVDLLVGVLDVLVGNGRSIVFDQKFIDGLGDTMKDAMDSAFAQYPGMENFMDEEIFFEPELFVFEIDDMGNTGLSDDWGPRYNELVDEYMKQKGIKDGWRERMLENSVEIGDADINSFLNLMNDKLVELSSETVENQQQISKKYINENKPNSNKKNIYLILSISFILLALITMFFSPIIAVIFFFVFLIFIILYNKEK